MSDVFGDPGIWYELRKRLYEQGASRRAVRETLALADRAVSELGRRSGRHPTAVTLAEDGALDTLRVSAAGSSPSEMRAALLRELFGARDRLRAVAFVARPAGRHAQSAEFAIALEHSQGFAVQVNPEPVRRDPGDDPVLEVVDGAMRLWAGPDASGRTQR